MLTPEAADLAEGGRALGYRVETSGARVFDVSYPTGTDFDTHEHAEAYLCLPVQGQYEEWLRDRPSREVRQGRPLVYRAGSAHAVRTSTEPVRMIHVSDPHARDWSDRHPLTLGLLWQIAATTAKSTDRPDDADDLHLEALVSELVSGRGDHLPLARYQRAEEPWLARLRHRIRDACQEPTSLSALADEVGRHPAHVARAFRAQWGITPGEYLRHLRVAVAVQALHSSTGPASEIALSSGFSDQSHMGRWLRRYTGKTPGAFRRMAGG